MRYLTKTSTKKFSDTIAASIARYEKYRYWASKELVSASQKACDNRSDWFQNMKAVTESLNVAVLVTSPSPPSHVQAVQEAMDFHAMKVMQKKVEVETAWIKALKNSLIALKAWCDDECKLGLIWKAGGEDAAKFFEAHPLGQAAAAAAASSPPGKGKGKGKGPPPPKAGMGPPPPKPEASGSSQPGGMAAVFSQIEGFSTAKLKTVTSDMKTKNRPKDEASSMVPAAAAKAPAAKASGARSSGRGPKGPPILELQKELNWVVENYEGVHDLTVEDLDAKQLVLFINCKNCTLRLTKKVKSICIDSCEKVNLICHDVISTVEIVNCERCSVQTTGGAHAFAIDKTNGANIWLSKASIDAEFVTSKSSEMNVTIPDPDVEDDFIELPIPEQFSTTIKGKKLKTEVSKIYSG